VARRGLPPVRLTWSIHFPFLRSRGAVRRAARLT